MGGLVGGNLDLGSGGESRRQLRGEGYVLATREAVVVLATTFDGLLLSVRRCTCETNYELSNDSGLFFEVCG